MEQVSALSMNPGSTPGSPRVAPVDKASAPKEKEADTETDTSSLASTSTITPDTASTPKDAPSGEISDVPVPIASKPSAEVKTARERALAGLDKNNFETEVHQVMGTLNSWWGGVKKQSTSALLSLKADVDKAVLQAQADLEHLKTTNIEIVQKGPKDDITPTEKGQSELEQDIKGKGKAKESSTETGAATEPNPGAAADAILPTSTSNFLSRLTSSTTQLQATLQSTIQSTIASAQANPALSNPAQFRDQLAQNLHLNSARENLQMSMKQAEKLAEEYMKKGDQLVKDAEKWMGDAVKVVPPEEQERRAAGMSWDGSDYYAFSTSTPTRTEKSGSEDAGRPERQRQVSGVLLGGSRKDALLRRLREDKDLLLVDPESEEESNERRQEYRRWVEEKWEAAKKDEREQEEGNVGGIRMALVPEHLTDDQFWQRYLFHKHMIEAEEEKRKAVVEASQQGTEEDFSWDDEADPDSATIPTETVPATTPASQTTPTPTPTAKAALPVPAVVADATTPKAATTDKMPSQPAASLPTKAINTSTSTSPRDSEESYDLVSDPKRSAAQTEDDDSDWE